MSALPTLTPDQRDALRRAAQDELALLKLSEFVRAAWEIVEPGRTLKWGPHLVAICDALEGVVPRREIRELVCNIPPGCMKSLLVSVFWPAFIWLHEPEHRQLFFSADNDLAIRDSRRTRQIITSDWYLRLAKVAAERRGAAEWSMTSDQNEKANFENTARGFRQCLAIGARVTGKRGDGLVIDDPYDVKEAVLGDTARVAERMAEVVTIYDQVLATRVNDPSTAYRVVIMQRLHTDDLAGVIIRRGAVAIVLPMEFDPDSADPRDWRTVRGELLFPAMFPADVVAALKVSLGSAQSAAQLDQRPAPATGGILNREWWRFVDGRSMPAPEDTDSAWQGWDLAFGGGPTADYCVGVVGMQKGAFTYLADRERLRAEFPQQLRAIARLSARWPTIDGKAIEKAANAKAVKSAMEGLNMEIPALSGIVLVPVHTDKVARAQMWSARLEAGNILLPCRCGNPEPHPHGKNEEHLMEPWASEVVAESAAFPRGANDDQVDAISIAIKQVTRGAAMGAN